MVEKQKVRGIQKAQTDGNGHPRLVRIVTLLFFLCGQSAAFTGPVDPSEQSQPQTSARSLKGKEISDTLDGETLLLEYMLGEEGSVLWAITRNSAHLYELPGRIAIEQAAQQVIELLTARLPRDNETNLEAFRRANRTRSQFPAAAENLSRMILGPVVGQLRRQRLLIVADGKLHFIPFAVLPKPGARGWGLGTGKRNPQSQIPNPPPLIVDHEIAYLPSASALGLLRQRGNTRATAPKLLALLADPVFERDDPRFKPGFSLESTLAANTRNPPDAGNLRSAAANSEIPGIRGKLKRLRFARQEADQILASLSPAERAATLTAFDFAANQTLALSPELEQYRYLHFATHGLLDNQRPELSGMALSLLDRNGQEQDGFLRLIEIYNLRLAADLVTLSACETGLGKQVNGEGIVGLTRGFLHAGAARVLVSLWKVDDRASARLMGRVYEGIFRAKLSPAAALRKAQLSFRQDPAMSDPFFWAAFVLHGEPR
jgi:CHAT domain-containing protein